MTLQFGTDGVRGDAESELTSTFVFTLGRAAATVLPGERWVVGRDTRASGPRIEHALSAGLASAGCGVDLLEVVPTPGVAHAAAVGGVPGAMVSASHNPWTDNGVKLFLPGGRKLTDDVEQELEEVLETLLPPREVPDEVVPGVRAAPEAVDRYRDWLIASLEGRRLDGLRVVLDCANGAASRLGPEVMSGLGATVEVLHASPDGTNINRGCGSTDMSDLRRRVPELGFDVGLAFDGDADRVLAVDERGELVDGDQIIAMCAIDRRDRGLLTGESVVVTVMSNLGFRRGMEATGIRVIETPVGDRNVLAALEERDLSLGGEQSGHIIFRDLAPTGDGILTGLQLCDLMARNGRFLSDIAECSMTRYPQVLLNVGISGQAGDVASLLATEIELVRSELGDDGRVLVRPSGTEPVVRVMVEAPSKAIAEAMASRLADAVRERLGSGSDPRAGA